MNVFKFFAHSKAALATTLTAALLAGCGMLRSPFPTHPEPTPPTSTPGATPPPVGAQPGTGRTSDTPSGTSSGTSSGTPPGAAGHGTTPPPAQAPAVRARPSVAADAKAYRKDAAAHIYANNPTRIYKGKLPPLLYAIGVLEVDVDAQGQIGKIFWKRAPSQAPEVMAEIEKMVRNATPFPTPTRLGKVTYTDVWLWDEDGKFQLDTLTEGQL
jgi:periplasmic protein TonB